MWLLRVAGLGKALSSNEDSPQKIVWNGDVPQVNMARVTRRLCEMSETAYISSMRSIGKGREIEKFNPSDENHWGDDEDLIVMYAQLLTSCYGVGSIRFHRGLRQLYFHSIHFHHFLSCAHLHFPHFEVRSPLIFSPLRSGPP